MIGLVFALPQELDSLRVKLGPSSRLRADGFTFYYTCLDGQPVVLARSGIGLERSRRAAEGLLKIFNVNAVVSVGLAGGVRDGVHTGDLIIARSVVNYSQVERPEAASASYPCHKGLVDLSCRLARERGLEFRCGDLLTVDEVVAQPTSKRKIGDATTAEAVDMEAVGVAEAAMAYKKPFLALKVLSDEIGDELKAYDLVDVEGRVRTLSVISYLINNPLDLAYLLRLHQKTSVALGKLALFLPYFIEGSRGVLNSLHVVEE
ncbi:MAG: hypothetical protein ACE5KK_04190 [Candidatus Brocadiales bacterium]